MGSVGGPLKVSRTCRETRWHGQMQRWAGGRPTGAILSSLWGVVSGVDLKTANGALYCLASSEGLSIWNGPELASM